MPAAYNGALFIKPNTDGFIYKSVDKLLYDILGIGNVNLNLINLKVYNV